MNEPQHPTYGTLDKLLATIRQDIAGGYELRLGLLGALNWFSYEYGKQRAEKETQSNLATPTQCAVGLPFGTEPGSCIFPSCGCPRAAKETGDVAK